ncbi:MarR family winged helix-turn-helix transcriptional regulator [Actinomadura geliboluensis]|uniref:Winged helix-turn-helix transcriptional regulator n=1 Tax=Actinomadura geliboluensis TaxID=882440 RepID=A0A5S4H9Q3_9ACTN|nr:MarR family winged helix-turn-helix transcriptional regulator [Actinomadura geliboluensis]TMR41709.1 winged helix-turn-helix transcriptional regulator [Actinomadura geliboluensis]
MERSTGGQDVAGKTVDAIDRLTVAYRAFSQQVAGAEGLSPLQLQVLTTLASGPPPAAHVDALHRELQVAQPTVSDAVKSLTLKGLVSRERDPADRRRHRLSLTPSGRNTADAVATRRAELVSLVDALPADARASVLNALLLLIAHLHSVGVITVARTCLTCRFHEAVDGGHYCSLLNARLEQADLRVDCPEHEPPVPAWPR